MKTYTGCRGLVLTIVFVLKQWKWEVLLAGSLLPITGSLPAHAGEPPQQAPGGTTGTPIAPQPPVVRVGGEPHVASPIAGPLTVLSGPGLTRVTSRDARYDFGQVSLFDTTQVEHTFTLQNDTHAPVKLRQLQPSCGCTSVFVGAQSASDASLPTLQPGQQLSVRALIDLTRLGVGPLHKYVSIFIQDVPQPVALLELQGTLLPSAVFAPSFVDFGSVPAGTGKSATVTLHYDPRIAKNGKLPTLYGNSPEVEFHPIPASEPAPSAPTSAAMNASLTSTQAFRITLKKDAPLGNIHAVIAFLPPPTGNLLGPEYQAALQALPPTLRNVLLSISGTIQGDLSAQPPELMVGIVNPDQEHTQKLILQGKNQAVFQNLKATCASPWLSVRLSPTPTDPVPPGSSAPGAVTQVWEVLVHPDAPSGFQHSQITFTLTNGQRLCIPVTIYGFKK